MGHFVLGCLLASLALVGLAGCNGSSPTELRIAVNPWPGYGYFSVAEERGFLSAPGAPAVEIIETASLSDSLRAFERGQVDLIGGTLAELADINSHGRRDASAILVLNRSIGGDMIVSTTDITSIDELKGKRVALEPASANVLVLAAAISLDGLALDQIELVPLPQGEMPEALAKGRIDAAITYPPGRPATAIATRCPPTLRHGQRPRCGHRRDDRRKRPDRGASTGHRATARRPRPGPCLEPGKP